MFKKIVVIFLLVICFLNNGIFILLASAESFDINSNDITFSTNLNFDLIKQKDFTDSFISGEAFGKVNVYTTYTNVTDGISFNGNPISFILLDNPIVTSTTKLKKDKNNVELKLLVKNNTTLNLGEELLVKLTPFNPQNEQITIDETTRNQKFSFTNSKGNPKLTEARKILLPPETTKVKIEINRNEGFLNKIKDRLPEEWKAGFVDKVRQEETKKRTFIITLDGLVRGDCESIKDLIAKKNIDEFTKNKLVKAAGCESNDIVFKVGDPDEKTATYNGKAVTVRELKQLLFDLGLITQSDLDKPTYTNEVNQAYWKLTCAIDEAKKSTLDPNLRLQTAENPLKCTVTHYEGYPDIKYIEDVSSWKEFILGLKTKIGNDISAYVNPATIGTIAAFIAWNAILPINAWILLVAGFVGTSVDVTVRVSDVKKLWNDPTDTNYTQTSHWKTGYSVGTLLTAVPNLIPANVGKNVKAAEIASKLDEYTELQKLIIGEQRVINELTDTVAQNQRQGTLNNFAGIIEKVNQDGRRVLNDVVKRFINRGFDKSLLVKKLGLTSSENIDSLIRVINRDNLAIPLNDKELNDLVFVIGKNVNEERLNQLVQRINSNLITGALPSDIRVGRRILSEDAGKEILEGKRTLSNLSGKTFCSEIENISLISDFDLIKNLGLDTISDLDRFIGQKTYVFDIPTNGLKLELPNGSLANESFIKGGITSGGEFEFWINEGWTSELHTKAELETLGVKIIEMQPIKLSEDEIRKLLSESLNPPDLSKIDSFINALKETGRI